MGVIVEIPSRTIRATAAARTHASSPSASISSVRFFRLEKLRNSIESADYDERAILQHDPAAAVVAAPPHQVICEWARGAGKRSTSAAGRA